MRYLSMFSGIEAASVAWEPLGWTPAAFCEIEAAPSAVLAHHWPHVPNLGDVTKADFDGIGPIDLAVFGSPCQSFSIAGKRLGLDDPRGNLALYALGVVERLRPRWFLFENVPGLLSSGDGRDFGAFLGTVGDIGYQCAWRTLDAQYFGVPQRRRRVFVVGYLGDWRRAAAVLFERHSLQGHPAPRRETREDVARSIRAQSQSSHREDSDNFIAVASTGDTSHCLNAGGMGRQDYETETLIAHSLRAEGFDASEDGTGRGTPLVPVWSVTQDSCPVVLEEQSPSLKVGTGLEMGQPPAVAFTASAQANSYAWERDVYPTLPAQVPNDSSNIQQGIRLGSAVRRLTPRECERLQGFPDDFTLVPYRKGLMADGPRYKMLGNSMAVPCIRWLGERIAMVDAIPLKQAEAA